MGAAVSAAVMTGAAGIFAAVPAANAAPVIYLPFPAGQTRTVTNFPHNTNDPDVAWAVDIGMNTNDPISASASGIVRTAGSVNNANYNVNGNQVIIDHGGDFCTQYNHLNTVSVSVNQTVTRGQNLGGAGATGAATGVHLHWNTIYCSTQQSRGPFGSFEYPGGFYDGQVLTSKNSTASIQGPGDIVAVNAAAELLNYGGSAPLSPVEIGHGWSNATSIHVTDWDKNGVQDVLVQWTSGIIDIYYGAAAGGFSGGIQIGNGWANMDIQVSKWEKTGYPGLLAKNKTTGDMFYYENTNGRNFASPVQIGNGWSAIDDFSSVDWDNDGDQDVIAISKTDGNLYVYPGNGAGQFTGTKAKIGSGWLGFNIEGIAGFNGSANRGMLAVAPNGDLRYYPIGNSSFGTHSQIGNGWNTVILAGH